MRNATCSCIPTVQVMELRDWKHTTLSLTIAAAVLAGPRLAHAEEGPPGSAAPAPSVAPAADEPGCDVPATAPARPATHLAVGAGMMVMPTHPGSARMRVLPMPYIDAHAGPVYVSALKGVGLELGEGALYLGASAYLDWGRKESSDPARLRGRADIGMAADARVYGGLRLPLGRYTLAHAEISGHRHLGGSDGYLADATLGLGIMPSRRWMVDVSASSTWMDNRYGRTFFDSSSGIRDVTFAVYASYAMTDHWSVGALARGGLLVGDAASSAVVATRFQPTTMAFVSYAF